MSSNLFSTVTNYSGRQPDNSQGIKQFVTSITNQVSWIYKRLLNSNLTYITTADQSKTIYIPKDLIVVGSIFNPSDEKLKNNIIKLNDFDIENITKLKPVTFSYNNDTGNQLHYGFIAQDVEEIFPALVSDNTGYKSINYIEFIPIMLYKMQQMQDELDELKQKLSKENNSDV
uniref:Peptidase S74 domain-containing protein n=1 Tax=viral metagenome TaxID=1070528 RepID=A0A6C0ICX0_9ZZZZ